MIRNWIIGVIAVLFGFLTLVEGGTVLFQDGPERAAAGNYVPIVLWVNFLSGFVYIMAGVAIALSRHSGLILARALVVILLLLFGYFVVHILIGGAWEYRTLVAMTLRLGFWVVAALLVRPKAPAGAHGGSLL